MDAAMLAMLGPSAPVPSRLARRRSGSQRLPPHRDEQHQGPAVEVAVERRLHVEDPHPPLSCHDL